MSLINIVNLSFTYDGSYEPLFENVSFQIDTDWRLGFTGRNGRGKTTFLNLLLGKLEYSGTISASVDFEYFPYEVADPTRNTLEVIRTVCPDFEQWELERELSLLEVSEEALYRSFDTLSGGEQAKALLAALFLKDNRFLLIDEPTNHLDGRAREIVGRYLKSKNGFILVSHDRAFLDSCIDHILSINKTDITIQKGNFSSWWANKHQQDQFELDKNDKLKKDIRRLTASARQTAAWSDKVESTKIGFDPSKTEKNMGRRAYAGEKSRKLMQQSKNIEKRQQAAITEKSRLLQNLEESEDLKISQLPFHSSRLVLLEKVSIYYGEIRACGDVSLSVEQGDRIALCGKNGSGKSSVLKLLCGEPLRYTGTFQISGQLKISYVPQDASFLRGSLNDFIFKNGLDETLFKAILRKLDFSRPQFEKVMEEYSGGQKKKVLLAKSLSEKAHLHVWDEPLNYIDVLSRIQIEELLLAYQPTIVFVEHDSAFCDHVATKRIEL